MEVADAGCRRSGRRRVSRGAILIAVDQRSLTSAAAEQLEAAGFSTRTVTDGHEALRLVAETSPCLVVIGVSTPPLGGVELMRRMRASRRTPVILVATEAQATDRIAGLRLGADDYLVKPFAPAELAARVEAVLRRGAGLERRSAAVVIGRVKIEPEGRRVTLDGREVRLTALEYKLLWYMALHPGQALSRVQILEAVWGDSSYRSEPTITVHIRRLRMKVEEDPSTPRLLETVQGVGYRLVTSA